MPRPKTLSDRDVLAAAHKPFTSAAPRPSRSRTWRTACGLSAFNPGAAWVGTKAGLKQSAPCCMPGTGWTRRRPALEFSVPKSTPGAWSFFVATVARLCGRHRRPTMPRALLVLREDLREPVLRARGAARKTCPVVTRSMIASPRFAGAPQGIGLLISQRIGTFRCSDLVSTRRRYLDRFVEDSLKRFVSAIVSS